MEKDNKSQGPLKEEDLNDVTGGYPKGGNRPETEPQVCAHIVRICLQIACLIAT